MFKNVLWIAGMYENGQKTKVTVKKTQNRDSTCWIRNRTMCKYQTFNAIWRRTKKSFLSCPSTILQKNEVQIIRIFILVHKHFDFLFFQLLIEPNILFCDEPTTSLDSYGAAAVVRTLRALASRGKIVICSIHQPTSGLFNLFDEVILLSTGRVAFQGTTSGAESFFQRFPI